MKKTRVESKADSLKDLFLIAMPTLDHSGFHRSVVYICQHDKTGAMGLVINNPTDVCIGEVMEQMDIPSKNNLLQDQIVLSGGPVDDQRGFFVHHSSEKWQSSFAVTDEIHVTSSKDFMYAIAGNKYTDDALLCLGHAGWEAGQLEQELIESCWIIGPANPEIIFKVPYGERWAAALSSAGIDARFLSTEIGHA